jgi:hypothetical protein
MMIYGIDFDGTIVEHCYPQIGEPKPRTVEFIRWLEGAGHQWVLITMREGKRLQDAVEWLNAHDLHPSAVNDNIQMIKDVFECNPRKIFANMYIDDHNAGGLYIPDMPTEDVTEKLYPKDDD